MRFILKHIRRLFKTNWINLRSVEPISRVFGIDRGTPVDRMYIQHFLDSNKKHIKGTLCEIADNEYSKKYGSDVNKYEILQFTDDNPRATIVADLTDLSTLPHNKVDCFILTQTLNFIYDFKGAIKGLHFILKENGVALVTVAGISQISRYDMDKWGDFWRFTDQSIKKAFEEVFDQGKVEVIVYGNVLSAIALLEGISSEELSREELFHSDKDYQVTIAIKAIK
jgi:hypothetical protein